MARCNGNSDVLTSTYHSPLPELYEHRWTHTTLYDPAVTAVTELYAPLILESHAHEITFTPN
jgi:hypothetical protein